MTVETRYCAHCSEKEGRTVRHPISEFHKGRGATICKKGRKERLDAQKAERQKFVNDNPGYTKVCGRGEQCVQGAGQALLAREHFDLDASRPDGYFPYCKACNRAAKDKRPKLIGKIKEFRDELIKAVLKVVKDQDRSIVRQIVEDFRHENSQVSFAGREWQIAILNDLRPTVVVRKPSQKGLTWVLERFIMALLMRYKDRPYEYEDHLGNKRNRFLEGIYSFETVDKASKWSKVRLEKVKQDNPHIRDALKEGKTDSALLMKLGRTALHLVGRATVSGVLTISADIVVIDEKDRDQNPDVSSQIGSRTLESPFMNTPSTKGVTRETSTPEVSGAGISLQYEHSDQAEWEIFCEKCETWQVMTYPECIGNFYEKGEEPLKDENGQTLVPFWQCMNCKEPIDWKTIGKWSADDPDYYENCRWVVQRPENYDPVSGAGIGGYQVPFAGPERSAAFFLAERDDPEHDIRYLYNHLVGLPYDDLTKTLTAENFQVRADVTWGRSQDARGIYVLGCDHHPSQGGFITIYRQIPDTVIPTIPEGKWELVWLEHVKSNRDLFDQFDEDSGKPKKGRLYELILEYNIAVSVLDQEPDTNEVEKLIQEFGFGKSVWADKSGMFTETFKLHEEEPDGTPVCKILEDKTGALDWYFNRIRFGYLQYPESERIGNLALWKQFREAHTNLYKGEVENRHKGHNITDKIAAQNVKEVYKKRQGKIHDHWVMSGKFAAQATRVLVTANLSYRGIVPPAIRGMNRIPGT